MAVPRALRTLLKGWRRSWKTNPRYAYAACALAGVASAELVAYLCHHYHKHNLESADPFPPDEDHDDEEHLARIRALFHSGTPDPRKFLQDMFAGTDVASIPRSKALHVLSAYLTYRRSESFAGGSYPREVVREAERLLTALEARIGVPLHDDRHDPIAPCSRALFERGPDSCVLGGPVHALHKPLTVRAAIYGMHKVKAAILFANGFRPRTLPAHRDVVVWVKAPASGVPSAPPLLFAHGFGMGLLLYVPLLLRLAGPEFENRYVVCPEMPLVSQRDTLLEVFDFANFAERHFSFPNPRGVAAALLAAGEVVLDEQAPIVPHLPRCVDLIAHSWGTGVSAALHRIAPPCFVRQRVLMDPICALPLGRVRWRRWCTRVPHQRPARLLTRFAHTVRARAHSRAHAHTRTHAHTRARTGFPVGFTKWMRFFWGDELKSLPNALSYSLGKVMEGNVSDAYQCMLVRTDLSHQFVVRRKTYFTELLFDPTGSGMRNECPADPSTLVLVSGSDSIVPSDEVEDYVRRNMPGAGVVSVPHWQHGAFLYAADAGPTLEVIFGHVSVPLKTPAPASCGPVLTVEAGRGGVVKHMCNATVCAA